MTSLDYFLGEILLCIAIAQDSGMMPILTSRRVPGRFISLPGFDYRPDHGIDRHVRPILAAERYNVSSSNPLSRSRSLAACKLVQLEVFLNIKLRIDEVLVQKGCDDALHLRNDARQHRECVGLAGL